MNRYAKEGIPFLFILDFIIKHPVVFSIEEAKQQGIRWQINHEPVDSKSPPQKLSLDINPVSFETYKTGFDKVQKAIQAGDTYLLNLCYPTPLRGITSLEDAFEHAVAPFKLLMPSGFVVFSPEQFVTISEGVIRTFPMKGTIDASVENADQILLDDLKEQEEHATVVDLLRNDLSIVADKVEVIRYRYLSRIITAGKTLLQCSSEISGRLTDAYVNKPGSIMHALLPAGSVTGAPKKKTVELINAIEPESRGYYTGVFGVYDKGKLDSGVMIRLIEQRADGFYYRSGGGITYRSEAREEYEEMLQKIYIPYR
jgi:para-aminobenzoate synthetase component 1